jgi:hypothetical protein
MTETRTAQAIMTENLEQDKHLLQLYEIMERALAPQEGKHITRRFVPIAQQAYDRERPSCHVYYRDAYGRLSLSVRDGAMPLRQHAMEHIDLVLLASTGDEGRRFSMVEFEKVNHHAGQFARQRIAAREAMLASNKPAYIDAMASAVGQAYREFLEACADLPDRYALEELAGVKWA